MAMALSTTNKIFFVVGLIFQIWWIVIYALDYYYVFYPMGTILQENTYGFNDFQGFLLVLFLLLLFFLGKHLINAGFTLVSMYVAGSAYSTALFAFMIIVFTIQYYFIIFSFWNHVGLGRDDYNNTLGDGPYYMIRLHANRWRPISSYRSEVGMD